jgi:hypothetical protein
VIAGAVSTAAADEALARLTPTRAIANPRAIAKVMAENRMVRELMK